MGERNCIYLKNDDIYLYSHWDTKEDLQIVLRNALKRGRERWTDPSYLNRIIFSELIKKDILELTGYGLGKSSCDGDIVWTVDVEKQTVDGISFEDFIKTGVSQ